MKSIIETIETHTSLLCLKFLKHLQNAFLLSRYHQQQNEQNSNRNGFHMLTFSLFWATYSADAQRHVKNILLKTKTKINKDILIKLPSQNFI